MIANLCETMIPVLETRGPETNRGLFGQFATLLVETFSLDFDLQKNGRDNSRQLDSSRMVTQAQRLWKKFSGNLR